MNRPMSTIFFLLLATFFSSCNEDAIRESLNNSNQQIQESNLVIKLTDAPFEMDILESVEVEISKIDMRHDGEFVTLHEGFVTYDILKLRGGLTETLVNTPIEPGTIDHLRLFIESATITMKNGDVYPMNVPSGAQTGLKLFLEPSLEIVTGHVSYELILDFDISQSFIPLGNPSSANGITGFNFNPVVRVANESIHGRISGVINSDMCNSDDHYYDEPINLASVKAFQDDELVASAGTDEEGNFVLFGMEPGHYEVVMSASNHLDASFEIEVFVANDSKTGTHTLAGDCVAVKGAVKSDNGTYEDREDFYELEDVLVSLFNEQGELIADTYTLADGFFSFPKIFKQKIELEFYHNEHYDKVIHLEGHESDDFLDVTLEQVLIE